MSRSAAASTGSATVGLIDFPTPLIHVAQGDCLGDRVVQSSMLGPEVERHAFFADVGTEYEALDGAVVDLVPEGEVELLGVYPLQ